MCEKAIKAWQSKSDKFDLADSIARNLLSKKYEETEDYANAAKILEGIRLTGTQRVVTDAEKADTYVKIA